MQRTGPEGGRVGIKDDRGRTPGGTRRTSKEAVDSESLTEATVDSILHFLVPNRRINADFGLPWIPSVVHSVCERSIREPGCHKPYRKINRPAHQARFENAGHGHRL